MSDQYNDRDLPVLREVVRRKDEQPHALITDAEISEATGIPVEDVRRAAKTLQRQYLVTLLDSWGVEAIFKDFRGPALERVGAWPTPQNALDRMIAAVEAIATNTDDEDTRTRARKLRDNLTGAGKTIGLSVATAVITGQLPGQ